MLCMNSRRVSAWVGLALALGWSASLKAQNLGWEGETGVFVTPLVTRGSLPSEWLLGFQRWISLLERRERVRGFP